jgi:hypothetical protein
MREEVRIKRLAPADKRRLSLIDEGNRRGPEAVGGT